MSLGHILGTPAPAVTAGAGRITHAQPEGTDPHGTLTDYDAASAVLRLVHGKRVSDGTRQQVDRKDGWRELSEFLEQSTGDASSEGRMARLKGWLSNYAQRHRERATAMRMALEGAHHHHGRGGPEDEPDDVTAPGDDWPALEIGSAPEVEAFPDDVLPEAVADFIRVTSASIGCPVDFVGLPALVAAGAAIGRSVSLRLKPGYFVSASLYAMNVGGPTSGKSPALDAAVAPIRLIDEGLHDEYRSAMEDYAQEKAADKSSCAPKPALQSAMLDDCTVEAVAPHLALNPRGLLVARDEGSAWLASLDQYKKKGSGTDRQFWLSALFGKTIRVDRKGNLDLVPIRVPHPFISVVGNMTPEMLGEFREQRGRSDGFVERILFAFPDPLPRRHWSDEGVPEETKEGWGEIIRRLRGRPMAVSELGKLQPQVVSFSPEAKAEWIGWYNGHVDETNAPGFGQEELAAEGKLCDFAARIALILHLLDLACDPTRGDSDPLPPVSSLAVRGAIRFWEYLRSHQRRARWYMGGGVGNPSARAILDWIRRHDRATFSVAQLNENLRWLGGRSGEPEASLDWLERRHAIRRLPAPEPTKGQRGRRPSPSYEVHPSICSR